MEQLMEKLALPVSRGKKFVYIRDIIRCEAYGNYTKVFLSNEEKPIIISRTLKKLENRLKPHNFIRTHDHHLVNPVHVTGYIKGKGGQLELNNGTFAEISTRMKIA